MADQLDHGIPWTQDGVQGLFYYNTVDIHPQLAEKVQFKQETIGIFVPSSTVYQPISLDHFTLEGVQARSDGRRRDVLVTVNVPFRFWPPILPGQTVANNLRSNAQRATDDSTKRMQIMGSAGLKDVTIIPVDRSELPLENEPPAPDFDHPRESFGGRRAVERATHLQHSYPLPRMTARNGRLGYPFQFAGSGRKPGLEIFVPWTAEYGPVAFTDPQSGELFRFWPPAFPDQRIAPHFRSKTIDGKIERISTPMPTEPVTFPLPRMNNGLQGHLFEARFPKYKVRVAAGTIEVRGILRRYNAQDTPALIPPQYVWVRDTAVYGGPVELPSHGQPLNCNVQLHPIPGQPKSVMIQIHRSSSLRFRYYPVPLPGQTIPEEMKADEDKIDARHAMRTFQIRSDGADHDYTIKRDEGRDGPENPTRKKEHPGLANMSRMVNRKNHAARVLQSSQDLWNPAASTFGGGGVGQDDLAGFEGLAIGGEDDLGFMDSGSDYDTGSESSDYDSDAEGGPNSLLPRQRPREPRQQGHPGHPGQGSSGQSGQLDRPQRPSTPKKR